jgi:hypothetical protein
LNRSQSNERVNPVHPFGLVVVYLAGAFKFYNLNSYFYLAVINIT